MIKHAILCVDDEIDNVDALERLFRKKYRVLKATSGQQALDLLAREPVSLIISDQRMPNMSGVEFLRESMRTHPFAIRILLTGYTDMNSVIAAINSGEVYRYITKPWDPVDLANTVDKAIEKYELAAELKEKNIALEKALDELKSLDQAKSQFMVLVNHELKTPLTTVLSFAELLKETDLSSDQRKYLTRIQASGWRLKEIIEDVLKLMSAETGVLPFKPQKVAAKNLLPKMEVALEQEAEKKNLKFKIDVPETKVVADAQIVKDVLHRIIHNAIKFCADNSEIHIAAEKKKEHLKFAVENFGEPLSKKMIEQIFKPFTLNEDVMNHSRGLGLGLSLCQALLKRSGSELQIDSIKNNITVSFNLPLA